MRPIILILGRPLVSETKRNLYGTYQEVSEVITRLGCSVIQLCPPTLESLTEEEEESLLQILSLCDGVLLQGGSDFYEYDLYIARKAYEQNIPTLGICLGMQTMACAFQGMLDQIQNHQSLNEYVHPVRINKESQLYQIIGHDQIMVNSRHQEVVTKTNLSVVARSESGSIEAVEDPSKRFYIGVQWHPETIYKTDIYAQRLFQEFLIACQEEDHTKKAYDAYTNDR